MADVPNPFPREALAAAAYRFEQANGNRIELSQFDEILDHKLTRVDPDELAESIRATAGGNDTDPAYRASAYFALGKKSDPAQLTFFQDRLRAELEAGELAACYQIMIALDNLDEPIFAEDRDGSFSQSEEQLNRRDAQAYLHRD